MSRAAQGLRAWLLQRFTAIYLAIYFVSVLTVFFTRDNWDYVQWHSWLSQPLMGISTVLFLLAVLLHVWVGVRDVLIDYIHVAWLRLMFMAGTALMLLVSLLWILRALSLAALLPPG
ncbi:succinate dehydrogenase / fumarate reductase membrane anchor subunit [Thiogranum longum]|uniref:Succinate dehydrogenase hydrophobic membrane anchor subunit n=1 Tax=Thiogranum longum TaxID=1537524 RepID=A0A4R1HE04_9GAMM|nr:succinate dehydrogenase, hydrophobic membrane anchor protein [Thiogranum longum]TCK18400.1 succinate dehydrogenase / fumarate reductase membrane anchor subunit [Thiogranum longum]